MAPPSEQAELSFAELVDAAPDGMLVCDAAGVIMLVNRQVEAMFGYQRQELIGKRIEELIPERFRPRHPEHVMKYVAAPKSRPMGSGLELFGRKHDGSEFPVEISLSPIRTATGTAVSAAIRDVTDRKRIEAEARRANSYLISAVDSIQDAFALYDEEDRVVLVNSTFRERIGVTSQRPIVGRRFAEVLDELIESGQFDVATESADQLRARMLAYHEDPSGFIEVRMSSGHTLRITDQPTAEHGTVSLMVDITEDRLRADELRRAREQAEAASAAKSEFLASMSHELRTPLNAVLGFAQLLQRDKKEPLSGRQLDRIDHVMRGGEHLLRLIDEVLDLARIEAGNISISAEPVDLDEVVREVATTLEPMAQRLGVTLSHAHGSAAGLRIVADRTRLAQILMNFGSNAIKYNKPGGGVTFKVTRDRTARVAVIDNGIGIPEDKRTKIFEPFHRAGQEAGPIQGTGIGLAISKRLAELMHGCVGFSTTTDQGSEFWVEIPIEQSPDRPIEPVTHLIEESPLVTGSRHKIIYIEDNPSNIAFMRELINDLAAIELLVAPTAEIGLELVRAHLPDVVIMDINLPGMSGIDATAQLARWSETKDIPVIALTAAALPKDAARGRDSGFYRYLTKPVKVQELMTVLEELLVAK